MVGMDNTWLHLSLNNSGKETSHISKSFLTRLIFQTLWTLTICILPELLL